MIRGNGASSKFDEESSKVVQFPDPLDNLHKTLNLLCLPNEVASNTKSLEKIHSKLDALQELVIRLAENVDMADRYLDAKEAAAYLGMSLNTFDKYRYNTKVKIKGHKLDGKIWYKKSDLDLFMLTYDVKSRGIA